MNQVGPVQEVGEILSVGPVGAYRRVPVLRARRGRGLRAGSLRRVAVGGEESALVLRRAFALYGATPSNGTVRFVVAENGAGTRWLCRQTAGTPLDLVGPLGNPFLLPLTPRPVVLVGGGYGTAPLIPLAERLTDLGCRVVMVIGAATADRLFGELAARPPRQRGDRDHRRRLRRPSGAGDGRAPGDHRADRGEGDLCLWTYGNAARRRRRGSAARHTRAGGGRGGYGVRDRSMYDVRPAGAGR